MTRYTGTGSQNSNYTGIIEVTQGSQSVTGNYSMVNIKLILKTGASHYSDTGTTLNLTVNGEKVLDADYAQRSVSPNTENILWSKAVKVQHNADGTKTVAISGSIVTTAGYSYLPGTCSMSGNFALTTIPRASSFGTISGNTLGSGISININRAAGTSYKHKLYYSFGALTNQSITDEAGTSIAFTPPLALCSQIPNATSGALTIYMETYSSGTKIGNTVSKTITVNVPASVVPTIGAITVSEAVADVQTKAGVYVQGLSKLNLAITNITEAYKSEIKSYMIVFEDVRYPTQTAVSDFIKGSGSLKITASVTDTRGRTATKEMTINVVAYSLPAFASDPTAARQSDTATNVDVISSGSVSSIKNGTTEKNALKLYVLYKLATASSYPAISDTYLVSTSGLTFSSVLKTLTGINASKSYNIKVVLQDNFKETAWELSLGTEIVGYDFNRAGLGIGKYRENGALDVKGDIYADENLVAKELISVLDDVRLTVRVGTGGVAIQRANRADNTMTPKPFYTTATELYGMTADKMNRAFAFRDELPEDTGWVNCTYSSGFSRYATSGPDLQVRRIGKLVHMRGQVKRTGSITPTSDTSTQLGTIPAGFRPGSVIITGRLQGSATNSFMLRIETSGAIYISRYNSGGSTNAAIGDGAWLNCFWSWMLD